ncbi:short-chain dehydrogenase TIC 32, chloroplastic-like [Herrania umbratica]|uniref:Short-chain dehydrogenase TIC 32, chloroplastic-like n=1 Tax=Herrania umbratica TaxID=108875 RepID=A0A6J1B928_9ROSI|nr:short-chain dehydrogenase TIC 32, chloroplastic-like [Herrania umbratica]
MKNRWSWILRNFLEFYTLTLPVGPVLVPSKPAAIYPRKGATGFSASSTAEEATQGLDGTGLTAIVTGASSGIGTETARVLGLRGVHVVMGVRNLTAGRGVKETIVRQNPNAKIDAMELDLSSMASVRKFAADFKSSGLPLNILM